MESDDSINYFVDLKDYFLEFKNFKTLIINRLFIKCNHFLKIF